MKPPFLSKRRRQRKGAREIKHNPLPPLHVPPKEGQHRSHNALPRFRICGFHASYLTDRCIRPMPTPHTSSHRLLHGSPLSRACTAVLQSTVPCRRSCHVAHARSSPKGTRDAVRSILGRLLRPHLRVLPPHRQVVSPSTELNDRYCKTLTYAPSPGWSESRSPSCLVSKRLTAQ